MDHMHLRGSDLDIDLESGGTTSEEDGSNNHGLTCETSNQDLHKVWNGFLGVQSSNGSAMSEDDTKICNKVLSVDELPHSVRCTEIWSNKVREEMENLKDNKMDIDKTRKTKPPRPPKGPSLDAADIKFVKEISELAVWKRRRTERIKALKKMKKESASPSKVNIFATVITILFFVVIIFQGATKMS